ncbi:MAG: amino acid permease, partial [Gammaproteobacteria bacterium]|nr:amino acid permease [Gammaproteobacteria bacterium]
VTSPCGGPALRGGSAVIPRSAAGFPPRQWRSGVLLVGSVVMAVLWYVLIGLSVAVALPRETLAASDMATGEAASALWGGNWAGSVLVLGGIGGILSSWNAFVIGGSRVMFALAESGQIPRVFARVHPRYRTPYVGIIAIGLLCCISPLFGRTILVWLVNVSSFGVTIAFLIVALAFLRLRQTEPDLARPFKVAKGGAVGWGAVLLSLALLSAFLPWSPSALLWPYEWSMILGWALIGLLCFVFFQGRGAKA